MGKKETKKQTNKQLGFSSTGIHLMALVIHCVNIELELGKEENGETEGLGGKPLGGKRRLTVVYSCLVPHW